MIDSILIARKILSIIDQMHELRRPKVVPSEDSLQEVLENVFWSSVEPVEGKLVNARVFFAPEQALSGDRVIRLVSPHIVSKQTILQLSLAHDLKGGLLVVEDATGKSHIKGILGCHPFARVASPLWLYVECRGPGKIRVYTGWQILLEFDCGKESYLCGMSIDRSAAEFLLRRAALFPSEPSCRDMEIASLLINLGLAIENNGTGGAIWILPTGASMNGDLKNLGHSIEMSTNWLNPYQEMWEQRTLMLNVVNSSANSVNGLWQAAQEWDHRRQDAVIGSLSSLAKVDGAIVVNGTLSVLAFGVICNKFSASANEIILSRDASNPTVGELVDAATFGGSRHRSAIDFCSSYTPSGAIVVSHDGGLTVFASWERGRVIGCRVSTINSDAEVGGHS